MLTWPNIISWGHKTRQLQGHIGAYDNDKPKNQHQRLM